MVAKLKKVARKAPNYKTLKRVLLDVINYLSNEAFFEENLNYDKKDIQVFLHETVNDAIEEFFK